MDYKFTAGMENKLDQIADKKAVWNKVLSDFYGPFIKEVDKIEAMDIDYPEDFEICNAIYREMMKK